MDHDYDLLDDIYDCCFGAKEECLLDNAEKGNANAMNLLGLLYFRDGSMEQGLEWFRRAAENGCADALYHIGIYYQGPFGFHAVEPSLETAIEYYKKAADAGCARAMCELGELHLGMLIDRLPDADAALGIQYLHSAAQAGDSRAHQKLAYCYRSGNGVERDLEKALEHALEAYNCLEDEMFDF